jgi:hypothetical protein
MSFDEFKEVRWDASYLCRKQGLAGPASGRVEWGNPYGEYKPGSGVKPHSGCGFHIDLAGFSFDFVG